jgi:hypothetical protein
MCDDTADMWHSLLSFLRTNKALNSLVITLDQDATESRVSAFRINIAAMLQEDIPQETRVISIQPMYIDIQTRKEVQYSLIVYSLALVCKIENVFNWVKLRVSTIPIK